MHKSLTKNNLAFPIPDLTNIQKESYKWFFTEGIKEILEEINPIVDTTGRDWVLHFNNLRLEKPKLSYTEAQEKGVTYNTGWYLTLTLEKKGSKQKKVSEQYMGEIPLMTPGGSFIINGVEKVVVSQLTRSYGILFLEEETNPNTGKPLTTVKILPKYGAWMEINTNKTGFLSIKIDKKRKLALTTLLRIFGYETDDQIRKAFEDVDIGDTSFIEETLSKDPSKDYNSALLEIYKKLRPGEIVLLDNAKKLVETIFFDKKRYNLGKVGRFKLNLSLELNQKTNNSPVLTKEDITKIVKKLIQLNNGIGSFDQVDDFSNRRVKAVGELLQQQVRIGFIQMERNIKERMSLSPRNKLPDISSLVSTRPVSARVQSFFASSQLTQYPQQYNALTSLNTQRRLSVLGPGGLTRERASYSVRDIQYTQYGRIDPLHTPEGQSVGLISYLSLYARLNEYGFLETPYRKLKKEKNGKIKVTNKIVYMPAYEEKKHYITDASVNIDKKGYITDKKVPLRKGDEFRLGDIHEAEYIDVSTNQILGLVSGLVPFVGNNDPVRVSVACQQIVQAVPLVKPQFPFVGTGLEEKAAENSGSTIKSDTDGIVEYVDATKIIIKDTKNKKYEYTLPIYKQSNSNEPRHFRPTVDLKQKIKKGDLIAESLDSDRGKIALGANLRVAYMIWDGYNYEDSIIISDRVVKEDLLTSITIDKHTVSVQETKLGPQEVTADIPNVPERHLRHLDERGIVTVGSRVSSGDILVGLVQPKGEVELSAEERLLRAIFGEKAKDVRDVSLRVPHGKEGVVIGIKEFDRSEKEELPTGVLKEITVYIASVKKIGVGDKLSNRAANKGVISKIVPAEDMPFTQDGKPIDVIISATSVIGRMNIGQLLETSLGWVAEKTGNTYEIPSFTKIPEGMLENLLKKAGLPVSGKTTLIDGRTGKPYDMPVLVGNQYILKLHHMSEEKMHARSTGPYSLITQQPLGGKAQFGGQRLGEMEVWALEAYGAAYTLQEMLTIKSDDVLGRNKAYSAILKDEEIPEPGLPESFKLLVRELNGLLLKLIPIKKNAGNKKEQVDAKESEINNNKVSNKKEGK